MDRRALVDGTKSRLPYPSPRSQHGTGEQHELNSSHYSYSVLHPCVCLPEPWCAGVFSQLMLKGSSTQKNLLVCTHSQAAVRLLMGTVFPRSAADVCGSANWERGLIRSKTTPLPAPVLGPFSGVSKGTSLKLDRNILN